MDERTCVLPGCGKPPRNRTAELCGMHYHRQYRHGSVDALGTKALPAEPRQGCGYRQLYIPGHPLAARNGKVYEHRAVLFDAIGPGVHRCHWCEAEIEWLPRGDPRCLQVDHLNAKRDDNRAENLVPSCGPCNIARAQQARSARLRALGFWSGNDTVAALKKRGRRDPVERVA